MPVYSAYFRGRYLGSIQSTGDQDTAALQALGTFDQLVKERSEPAYLCKLYDELSIAEAHAAREPGARPWRDSLRERIALLERERPK